VNELFRALPALLSQFEANEDLRTAVVFAAWRKIAGASLRRQTAPAELAGTTLVIAVAEDNWKRHLEHLAGQMIFRINSVLGRTLVTFIDFRVNETLVTDERRRVSGPDTADSTNVDEALAEVSEAMERSAAAIADEDLRYRFLLAAGSCLARKRRLQDK
jgi:hypothetical protein